MLDCPLFERVSPSLVVTVNTCTVDWSERGIQDNVANLQNVASMSLEVMATSNVVALMECATVLTPLLDQLKPVESLAESAVVPAESSSDIHIGRAG